MTGREQCGAIPSALTAPSHPAVLHSVGKSHESEIRYQPFRMTPYLVKVRDGQGAEGQLCCVLLAERVHSGYEGNSPAQAGAQAAHGASVTPWVTPSVRKADCRPWPPPRPPARGRVSVPLWTQPTFVPWGSLCLSEGLEAGISCL